MDMRERKRLAAVVAAAVCVVLAVASLGFVHPAQDGSWSLAWLFQTTAEAPQGSAEAPSEEAEDAEEGADAADADGAASAAGDSSDGSHGDGAGSTSSVAGESDGSDAGGASSSGGGASSAPSQGGSSGGSERPATVSVRVSVESSSVGNPVSASGSFTFEQGATVYDALCALGLSVNAQSSQFGVYVAAIGGLAEKEYGGTSGWVFTVNGGRVNTSASSCRLSDGDVVRWSYVTEAS